MKEKRWSEKVSVQGEGDIIFDIVSVRQAAEFLILHWPEAHSGSWKHVHAQTACLDVLEGKRDAEDARRAFLEAAEEAGILSS
ncbi:DUF982 domain-containing protein [Chelativorans sp. SCAU2101]|uniref:DUF982 domain-containing protein n=1 Tax=Chelativorans petroleitrophicus TaxID=2975484 RepID=A0A9X2XBL2_9HYPH|nr:DUF982 domain-containing protein [Chelativorans petroleitrophicus]MCT8991247.1 DUF982 domain-containing protein [Chelativorans petroleitrophicus]